MLFLSERTLRYLLYTFTINSLLLSAQVYGGPLLNDSLLTPGWTRKVQTTQYNIITIKYNNPDPMLYSAALKLR